MSSQQSTSLAEGIRLMQAADLQGARTQFAQAVQESPGDFRAHSYLGIVLTRLGDANAGIAELQQAVQLQPTDSGTLFNLAVALSQGQRTGDARQALERVLQLDPGNAKARLALQQLPSAPAQPTYGVVGQPQPQPVYAPAGRVSLTGEVIQDTPAGFPQSPYSQPAPPSPYGQPAYQPQPAAYGQAPGAPPSVYGAPQPYGSPSGMTYAPMPMQRGLEPSTGTRILRGIGWGALLGQIWTIYIAIGILIFGGLAVATSREAGMIGLGMAVILILAAVGNAVMFAIAGFIIGAANMDDGAGSIVGIVVSFLIVGGQFLIGLRGVTGLIIGVFIAISFGRRIGAQIATKAQAPVSR